MRNQAVYPELVAEMAKRKVTKKQIALAAGISGKALYNKINGKAPFTWDEVATIRKTFFPDMTSDELFFKGT